MAEYGEIRVRIIGCSNAACRVEVEEDDEDPHWIPWSLIENNGEDFKDGYVGPMFVKIWKLEQMGVDYED